MGSRRYDPLKTCGLQRVLISGSFAPAGTGAVTDIKGKGFTATRSGVGQFTVTFDDLYTDCVTILATMQLATAADTFVVAGTYSPSAKTLILTTMTAGVAADIAANANNRVNFGVIFRNTSVNF